MFSTVYRSCFTCVWQYWRYFLSIAQLDILVYKTFLIKKKCWNFCPRRSDQVEEKPSFHLRFYNTRLCFNIQMNVMLDKPLLIDRNHSPKQLPGLETSRMLKHVSFTWNKKVYYSEWTDNYRKWYFLFGFSELMRLKHFVNSWEAPSCPAGWEILWSLSSGDVISLRTVVGETCRNPLAPTV